MDDGNAHGHVEASRRARRRALARLCGGERADVSVKWFAPSTDRTWLHFSGQAERLRELGADRSYEPLIAAAAATPPEGTAARS